MNEYKIVRRATLTSAHRLSGKTKHYRLGQLLPAASELKIAKIQDEAGFYLIRFDSNGVELTDTFHESVADAVAQANWEYSGPAIEWVEVKGHN